jgi:hypothetical protein
VMENEKFFFLLLLGIEGKLVFLNSSFSYLILELNIIIEREICLMCVIVCRGVFLDCRGDFF